MALFAFAVLLYLVYSLLNLLTPQTNRWYMTYTCINCEVEISDYEHAYSSGVCPKCGNYSNSTFVAVNKVARRESEDGTTETKKL